MTTAANVSTDPMNPTIAAATAIDDALSNRAIALDPGGYFIIYLDRKEQRIYAQHFTNVIDERGLACDPETGLPLPCNKKVERVPSQVWSGRTAKEVCVEIFERATPCLVTMLDHAAYLGRELQKAEAALFSGQEYVQD